MKLSHLFIIAILMCGCCVHETVPTTQKFTIPPAPKRPGLGKIFVFQEINKDNIFTKTIGAEAVGVKPSDYLGFTYDDMGALLKYVKEQEIYSDGLSKHPVFEVKNE